MFVSIQQRVCFSVAILLAMTVFNERAIANDEKFANCAEEVGRRFADYADANQKSPNKVAQFFSQKFLAALVNRVFVNEKNAGGLSALSIGNGTQVVSKKIACGDRGCQIDADMQGANGVRLHMLYDYASQTGTCAGMLIDHQTIEIDCGHSSDCRSKLPAKPAK